MTTSRAIHEIQTEGMKLATVSISSALESCDWVSLARLSERLAELADRGLYHSQKERQQDIAKFAMGNYAEREAR